MEKRVYDWLGHDLRVETFHSLGLGIIADVEGSKPLISELSTDNVKLQNAIKGFIQEKSENKEFLHKLNTYFAFHSTPYESKFHFETMGEYIDYLRNNNVRSLKGDRVKSLEECEIANFLYLNGIEYVYEKKYKFDTASRQYRQYTPDFYLPEYDIYIEHFGVDRHDKTAPFVNREKYFAAMAWKRQTHNRNQTTLLETYSWEKFEGVLIENLENKLAEKGVEFNVIPPEQIFERINELGLIHPFTGLLSTFLNLFKSSRKSISELLDQSRNILNFSRYQAFLDIFSEIYNDYEDNLGEEIDFNDMIIRAEEYVARGKYSSSFRYILVDEFQDISYSRYRLLKALLDQNLFTKIFCVGDDWQSIYRFTGSDINIMTDFDSYFNPSERSTLDKTWRFNNKLCDFSTRFILRNPNQIKKELTTHSVSEDPSVTSIWSKNAEDAISNVLLHIDSIEDKNAEIFILGRYNHLRPSSLPQFRARYPNLTIEYLTAHRSKGRETDYVIVVGLTSEGYAFPSQIDDDPVLELVLAKKENVPNAEERRLFYVAMTRAKKHVYLIANEKSPSSFIREIESGGYEVIIDGKKGEIDAQCPECKTGVIVIKQGAYNAYARCSNYPYCTYEPRICPRCGNGIIVEGKVDFMCSSNKCSFRASKCPNCEDGYLVIRTGPYSEFLGCSNYPACKYKRTL